jgi:uncharacterized membrane protein YgcG
MARTALLALLCLAGIAACSATPAFRWIRFSSGDEPVEPSCLTFTDQDSCLDHNCGWCSSSVLGDLGCLSEGFAKLVPEALADCKLNDSPADDDDDDDDDDRLEADKPEPKPKAPPSCGDQKERRDCLKVGAEEGDCAWCEGDFMPASCVGVKAAEWIPEQVAKCKMPKKHKKEDDSVEGSANKLAATCMDIKDGRECVKRGAKEGECAWCSGKFMPESCMGVDKAKFIPEQVAHCKMPKKHSLEKRHKKDDDSKSGGGGWGPSGGDWPSGGGDYPSGGGGDYPGPGGGGMGQGCMALKSKKKCLRGTDGEACAWCGEGSFFGSPCVSESVAKYIPPSFAKCKMGKKGKRNDAVDAAEKIAVA